MRAFLRYFVRVFLVVTLSSAASHAQSFEQRTQANIDSLKGARAKLSQSDRKIQSQIYDMIINYNDRIAAGNTPMEAAKNLRGPLSTDGAGMISVTIRTLPTSASERTSIEQTIHANGGVVHSSYSTDIYASLPISAIETVASIAQVASIDLPPEVHFRDIVSAGYTQLAVNQAYSTYGVTGEGVKVGVISSGVNDITTVENAGELPAVTIQDPGGTGSANNEGTAMLEIIHDLAPDASLYFDGIAGSQNPSYEDLANAVDALSNDGCRIIVDDAYYLEEPYFSDENDLGTEINKFITGATGGYSGGTWTGGTYVTAAGNDAQDVYGGTGNFNSGSINTFQDGKSYLQVSIPTGSHRVVLQWKDSWLTPQYDWGLVVEDANGNNPIPSNQTQGAGIPPIEEVNVTNSSGSSQTYRILVTASNIASEVSIPFKIFVDQGIITDNTTGNEVFGHSAYPGVISVAAYESDAQTAVASYSSRGPATMYSSETQQWQTENVPTITATSKVQTYVGSQNLWIENGKTMNPFDGTSAAAPAVAAIAGLFFQAHGSLSNQDFYNDLIATGTAVGSNPGGHNWYADAGYGKANALALLQKAASTVATPVFAPASGEVAYPLTVAITSATQGANIYYTEDGSDPSQSSTLYSAPVSVPSGVSNITFKAKAFPNSSQTGLNASATATATYVVSTDASPTVLPASGTYYSVVSGKVSFPAGYVLYYYVDSPGSGGHGTPATSTSPWYPVWGPASAYQGTHTYVFSLENPNTGTWGPSVSVQYTLNPGVVIRQEYQKDVGFLDNITTPTLPWSMYQSGQWQNYTGAIGFAAPTSSTDWYLLANRSWYPGTNQKYWQWQNGAGAKVSVPNYAEIPVDQNTSEIDGVFQPTVDANLQSQLLETGALGGYINFYDPWYPDENDPTYGLRNRGSSAIAHQIYYSSNTQYNIGTGSPNMGIFTGQGGPPSWTGTSYSINAPQTQTVGGHNAQFTGWSVSPSTSATLQNASANQTGVVFNSADAVITANYKGLQLSNDANAYSDNSQRKFIRIPDSQGHMFQVYTSMGHAWLESSTDNGQTWKLEYGGHPLDYLTNGVAGSGSPGSKCPSIDYYYNSTSGQDYVIVLFQEPATNGHYTIDYLNLWYDTVTGEYAYYFPRTVFTETSDSYSTNANPNVMIGSNGFVMTFERKSSSGGSPGINWIGGYLDIDGNITNGSSVNVISGTNSNSVNASVYCSKATIPLYFDPAVVWQQNYGTNSSDIMLAFVNFNYSQNSWTFSQSPVQDISTNLGDGDDYRPSIVEMADNSVRVCWITDQGGVPQPQFINVAYWSSANQNGYGTYGTNPLSVSINATDAGTPIFVWSQSGYNTASDNGAYMENLNTTGRDVQICNADTKSDMYVSSYYPSTLPYYFQMSNNLGSLQKSTPVQIAYGRGLSLRKGDLSFRYSLGDLIVDGNSVNFVSIPASTSYGNLDTLNGIFETEPFQINDNSKIFFTQDSGFLDSAAAAIAFGDTGFIRCHADLIDNSTGKVIGSIEDETFGTRNTGSYALARYQLNTDGVGTKTVRVMFSVTANIDSPGVAYVNSYGYENQTDTSNVQSVALQQLDIVRSFTLSQNYPNPFNPTTVISYAIPKESHVTLKIYDVLGQEVATLVNETQQAGRHSVDFDGSRFASGVYFSRLVAGDHVITKKMLMLK